MTIAIAAPTTEPTLGAPEAQPARLRLDQVSPYYGSRMAVEPVDLSIPRNRVTAVIGPSGCGKSTLLRTLNRMHETLPGATTRGRVWLDGQDIYAPGVDPTDVRRYVGMVFQRPNPFAKSIFDNVAFGLRHGADSKLPKREIAERVERALRQAALWDEVKDRLGASALALSGGQQQRLCIARAIAVEPAVILLDEPCSALDPLATLRIEDLLRELAGDFTLVIVTHNMQQAARVSDLTAFMTLGERGAGELVEVGPTRHVFTNPSDPRTEDYIAGRVG